jgi:predicted RNA binding protein YcfA (HicA-like mRNA interferase family)
VHRLPVVSGAKIIKYLSKTRGFVTTRTKGSHVILKSPDGRTVIVPLHNELDRGTLSNILLRAGISSDEFIEEWPKL